MRMSALFLRTLRDDPADAEVDSHRLLVRAGYIRRVSSGIYSWLPLGDRVLRKVTEIVREEMDEAGAQEVSLPIAQPLELWDRSGRNALYGDLMFRLSDRPQGHGVLPLADRRGGRDDARRAGVRLLPRPAGEPVPDQLEVPRRAPSPLRAAPQPRVPDEGRVLVRPRRRRPASRATARCSTRTTGSSSGAASRSGRSRRSRARWAATSTTSSWRSPRSARTTSSGARAATTRPTWRPRGARRPADAERPALADPPPLEKVHTPDLPGIAGVSEFLGVPPEQMLKSDRVRPRRRGRARGRAGRPRGQRVRARGRARARSTCGCSPTPTSTRIPSSPRATSVRTTRAPRSSSPIRRSRRRSGGSPAPTRSTTTCATRCSAATSPSTSGPTS